MANSDKDILITPNTGTANKPAIKFNGANNNPVSLYVQDSGALTIEGSAGQLFSVSDSLTGTVFAVNDSVGMPSLDIKDTGDIRIAPFGGKVALGKTAAAYNLDVGGTVNANAYYQNGLPVGGSYLLASGALPTSAASVVISSILSTYKDLRLVLKNHRTTTNGAQMYIRLNNDATGSRHYNFPWTTGSNNQYNIGSSELYITGAIWSSANYGITTVDIRDYANGSTWKRADIISSITGTNGGNYYNGWFYTGIYNQVAAINAIGIYSSSGNFSAGTYELYGVR